MGIAFEKVESLALKLFNQEWKWSAHDDFDGKTMGTRCWRHANEFYEALPVDIADALKVTEPDTSRPYVVTIERPAAQVACTNHLTDTIKCYFFRARGDGTHELFANEFISVLLPQWHTDDGPIYVIVKEKNAAE